MEYVYKHLWQSIIHHKILFYLFCWLFFTKEFLPVPLYFQHNKKRQNTVKSYPKRKITHQLINRSKSKKTRKKRYFLHNTKIIVHNRTDKRYTRKSQRQKKNIQKIFPYTNRRNIQGKRRCMHNQNHKSNIQTKHKKQLNTLHQRQPKSHIYPEKRASWFWPKRCKQKRKSITQRKDNASNNIVCKDKLQKILNSITQQAKNDHNSNKSYNHKSQVIHDTTRKLNSTGKKHKRPYILIYLYLHIYRFSMYFTNPKWMTLIELLVVIILITGTISALFISNSFTSRLTKNIEETTIANAIATKWVEQVIHIRNSNNIYWSGQEDECWLAQNTTKTNETGSCWPRIQSWTYTIHTQEHLYFTAYNNTTIDSGNLQTFPEYKICIQSWQRWPCTQTWENLRYHYIQSKWLRRKDVTTTWWEYIPCQDASDTQGDIECWDTHAKERRFCSVVHYRRNERKTTKICSSLTNHQ